ncbi:hypothetical protein [Pseudotamlana agarivorans]|uniref:hypothetical protein n=1 Tax=Pseudotamlana agarivorans TaxID=481183 RepID=UPI000832E9A6|nr:hypothetical protein [Tamlana agarivorans]
MKTSIILMVLVTMLSFAEKRSSEQINFEVKDSIKDKKGEGVFLQVSSCSALKYRISDNHWYTNESEDFALPFNEFWDVKNENLGSVLVQIQQKSNEATFGVASQSNEYGVKHVSDLTDYKIKNILYNSGIEFSNFKISDTKIKNIPAKQVVYYAKIQSLDQTISVAGIWLILIKENKTYLIMLQSLKELKDCYMTFFYNSLQNSHFGPCWYGRNP